MADRDFYSQIDVQSLIDNWIDGVIVGDLTGKILTVNKAEEEISGYSRDELVGKQTVTTLVSKKHIPKALKMLKDLITDGNIRNQEVLGVRKDGRNIWVHFSASAVRDNKGSPKFLIAVVRDISDKKELEKQIAELNETLKLLNKILRHDILNDLSVVSGNIDTYFEYGKERVKVDEVLNDTKESVDRSISFISKMKELESAVASGEELKLTDIGEVLEEVKKEHEGTKITIDGNAKVLADQALYSIFDNLIKNAEVHGGVKEVNVSIKMEEGLVQIKVADQGKGVPDDVKKKLFTEGYKYGETGHSGLGLFIVRKTVERYGGNVLVKDNDPKGTVFVLDLPEAKQL